MFKASLEVKNYYIHRHVKIWLGFLLCLCGTLPLASPDFNIANILNDSNEKCDATPSATSFILMEMRWKTYHLEIRPNCLLKKKD